jgi:hypothetical protein
MQTNTLLGLNNNMNKILTIFTVAAIFVGVYYLAPIFNNNCLKPQVIQTHIYNCSMLNVKQSCAWLKNERVPDGYVVDVDKIGGACVTSSSIANYLVRVATKNKVGN